MWSLQISCKQKSQHKPLLNNILEVMDCFVNFNKEMLKKNMKGEYTDTVTHAQSVLISSSSETFICTVFQKGPQYTVFSSNHCCGTVECVCVCVCVCVYICVFGAALWDQDCVETRRQVPVINVFNNARSTPRGRIKTLPGTHRRIN